MESVSKIEVTKYIVSSAPVWVSVAIVAVVVVAVIAIILYRKKHKR